MREKTECISYSTLFRRSSKLKRKKGEEEEEDSWFAIGLPFFLFSSSLASSAVQPPIFLFSS